MELVRHYFPFVSHIVLAKNLSVSMRAVVWVLAWGKRESCMWNNLEGMRAWFVPLEPLSELRLQLWIFRALFSFILSFK